MLRFVCIAHITGLEDAIQSLKLKIEAIARYYSRMTAGGENPSDSQRLAS